MHHNPFHIGHEPIDHHHDELFQLNSLLNLAISHNDRDRLTPIIDFLEHYVVDHFSEEETLMRDHDFSGYDAHHQDHSVFRARMSQISLMYQRGKHTTHVVYNIQRFIDALIHHIQTVDVKLKALTRKDGQ